MDRGCVKANYACAMDPRAAWIPADQPTCEVKGTAANVNTELVRTMSPEPLAGVIGAAPLLDGGMRRWSELGSPTER